MTIKSINNTFIFYFSKQVKYKMQQHQNPFNSYYKNRFINKVMKQIYRQTFYTVVFNL